MDRYDKVFVPIPPGSSILPYSILLGHPAADKFICGAKVEKNVICLSIEELRELWDAAQDRACALQMGEPRDTKIFEAYLESKNIQL
jgi:hypothetical protein